MDIMRTALVVIVAYILGLGTGLVGGVVFSFREFAAPAPAASPPPLATSSGAPSAAPSTRVMAGADEASPSPRASVTKAAPSAVAASTSPAARTPAAVAEASPSPSAPEATDESPTTTSGAVSETESPAPSPSPQKASPEATAEKAPAEEKSILLVTANKGAGFAVYVDGSKQGVTPLSVPVTPDVEHTVKVVGGEKFKSWSAKVRPAAGQTRSIEAVLAYIPPPAPAPPPVVSGPAPRYYPPAPAPRYVPSSGGGGGGGRPGVTGNSRW